MKTSARRFAILLAFVFAILAGGVAASHHHAFRKSFHCYRPFDSLPSFSLNSMQAKDNCKLDYHEVLDAVVRVDCYHNGNRYAAGLSGSAGEGVAVGGTTREALSAIDAVVFNRFGPLPLTPQEAVRGGELPPHSMLTIGNGGADRPDLVAASPSDSREGCYATMFIKSVRSDEAIAGGRKGYAADDSARYAVKLHTQGGGVVHYKGMDGMGYSVCCSFLNQPRDALCDWRNVTKRDDAAEAGDAANSVERVLQYCGLEGALATKAGDVEADVADAADHNDDDPLGIMGSSDAGNAALLKRREDRKLAKAVVGYVTKPLHRDVVGTWSMETLFFRGHTAVGKVVSDFNITDSMLKPPRRQKLHADHRHPSDDHNDHITAKAPANNNNNNDVATVGALVEDAVAVVPAEGRSEVATRNDRDHHHHGRDHHRERHHRKHRHHTSKDNKEESAIQINHEAAHPSEEDLALKK